MPDVREHLIEAVLCLFPDQYAMLTFAWTDLRGCGGLANGGAVRFVQDFFIPTHRIHSSSLMAMYHSCRSRICATFRSPVPTLLASSAEMPLPTPSAVLKRAKLSRFFSSFPRQSSSAQACTRLHSPVANLTSTMAIDYLWYVHSIGFIDIVLLESPSSITSKAVGSEVSRSSQAVSTISNFNMHLSCC